MDFPVSTDILAASQADKLLFSGVVLGGVIIGFAIFVFLIRRRARNLEKMYSGNPVGFSLSELEKMRDSGTISHEEFKKLRLGFMQISEKSVENSENSDSSTPPALDDSMLDSDN